MEKAEGYKYKFIVKNYFQNSKYKIIIRATILSAITFIHIKLCTVFSVRRNNK